MTKLYCVALCLVFSGRVISVAEGQSSEPMGRFLSPGTRDVMLLHLLGNADRDRAERDRERAQRVVVATLLRRYLEKGLTAKVIADSIAKDLGDFGQLYPSSSPLAVPIVDDLANKAEKAVLAVGGLFGKTGEEAARKAGADLKGVIQKIGNSLYGYWSAITTNADRVERIRVVLANLPKLEEEFPVSMEVIISYAKDSPDLRNLVNNNVLNTLPKATLEVTGYSVKDLESQLVDNSTTKVAVEQIIKEVRQTSTVSPEAVKAALKTIGDRVEVVNRESIDKLKAEKDHLIQEGIYVLVGNKGLDGVIKDERDRIEQLGSGYFKDIRTAIGTVDQVVRIFGGSPDLINTLNDASAAVEAGSQFAAIASSTAILGPAGTALAISNLVMGLSGGLGKNPDGAVLDQLKALSEQIENLRKEMNYRFDRVDSKLNDILVYNVEILQTLQETNRRLDVIEQKTDKILLAIENLEFSTRQYALDILNASKEVSKAICMDQTFNGLPVVSKEANDCASTLATWASKIVLNGAYSGKTDLDTNSPLTNNPFYDINAVNRRLGYTWVDKDPGLANPGAWYDGARDFLAFAYAYSYTWNPFARYATGILPDPPTYFDLNGTSTDESGNKIGYLDRIISRGKDIQAATIKLTVPVSTNPLDNVLTNYEQHAKDLRTALKERAVAFNKNSIRAAQQKPDSSSAKYRGDIARFRAVVVPSECECAGGGWAVQNETDQGFDIDLWKNPAAENNTKYLPAFWVTGRNPPEETHGYVNTGLLHYCGFIDYATTIYSSTTDTYDFGKIPTEERANDVVGGDQSDLDTTHPRAAHPFLVLDYPDNLMDLIPDEFLVAEALSLGRIYVCFKGAYLSNSNHEHLTLDQWDSTPKSDSYFAIRIRASFKLSPSWVGKVGQDSWLPDLPQPFVPVFDRTAYFPAFSDVGNFYKPVAGPYGSDRASQARESMYELWGGGVFAGPSKFMHSFVSQVQPPEKNPAEAQGSKIILSLLQQRFDSLRSDFLNTGTAASAIGGIKDDAVLLKDIVSLGLSQSLVSNAQLRSLFYSNERIIDEPTYTTQLKDPSTAAAFFQRLVSDNDVENPLINRPAKLRQVLSDIRSPDFQGESLQMVEGMLAELAQARTLAQQASEERTKSNHSLTVANPLKERNGSPNKIFDLDLAEVFADTDAVVAYQAMSTDTSIASVGTLGSILRIVPKKKGSATVTVSADDGHGHSVPTSFTVTVSDAPSQEDPSGGSQAGSGVVLGDVNGNKRVDPDDVSKIRQYLIKKITFTDQQKLAADVNQKDGVTSYDVALIRQLILGIIKSFPGAGKIAPARGGTPMEANFERRGKSVVAELLLDADAIGADLQVHYDRTAFRLGALEVEGAPDVLGDFNEIEPGKVVVALSRTAANGPVVVRLHLEGPANDITLDVTGDVYSEEGQVTGLVGGHVYRSLPWVLTSYPNPFNPSTTLEYNLESDALVQLKIYDVTGAVVRELVSEWQHAGWYSVVWDGRDGDGHPVGSGVYLGLIEANRKRQIQKLMLLK